MRAYDFQSAMESMMMTGELDEDIAMDTFPREIRRRDVLLLEGIGKGAFGEVMKGQVDEQASGGPPAYLVAVKMAHAGGADETMKEAAVMAQVPFHANVCGLVGVVSRGLPLLLIVSYCEHGSLLGYVKKHAQALGVPAKIKLCWDVAKGMAHLAQHHFVHRDLAARNVLVDSSVTGKIADFGLSRQAAAGSSGDDQEYYKSSGQATYPVRWTAPESMETMRFNQASDVWSYGVVCSEVFTDGDRPYKEMATNPEVISKVQAGHRMPQASLLECPDELYATILRCWHADAKARPSFAQLAVDLKSVSAQVGAPGTGSGARAATEAPADGTADDEYAGLFADEGAAAPQMEGDAVLMQDLAKGAELGQDYLHTSAAAAAPDRQGSHTRQSLAQLGKDEYLVVEGEGSGAVAVAVADGEHMVPAAKPVPDVAPNTPTAAAGASCTVAALAETELIIAPVDHAHTVHKRAVNQTNPSAGNIVNLRDFINASTLPLRLRPACALSNGRRANEIELTATC